MAADSHRPEISAIDLQRWQKAQQDLLKGRGDRAQAIYLDLVKKFPDHAELWFELGLAAVKQLEFELADHAFQRTAELSPENISLRILLGMQYHLLRRMDRARECFEQAAAMDPDSVHAQLSLADWYERERRLDDAWACVQACAARHPEDAQVRCYAALLRQRQGRHEEAEQGLRELIRQGAPDPNVRYSSRQQLASVLAETGRHAEALRWLAEAKAVLRGTADVARMELLYDQADRRRRRLLAELTPALIRRWRSEGATDPAPLRLAFLGGHPRSGTTLLEQILGAHPEIVPFDEPMAFTQEVLSPLAPLEGAPTLTANLLDHVSAARRMELRGRYLKNLGRESRAGGGGLLLEKNPSHTASIHLWLRIFPEVKVLISLRDPRDVVVSCYFQNLALNATNANFLSLDRTAKHYADLMDVWLRLRELGGFDWIETRYEDLVAGPEAEGRRVTEFLGLNWRPEQAAPHAAARQNTVVAPNYNQVAQPVYQRAVGRWRRYAEALAPLQERLAPYARAFKYD